MKRIISLIVAILMIVNLSACGKKGDDKPGVVQIRNVCQLATMTCYYHNVAKSEKSSGGGAWFWKEENRKFWIEYNGWVVIGIDASRVKIEIDGENVYITIPPAEVLDCGIDDSSITEDSYIASEDNWINTNKITMEDVMIAINAAQNEMEEEARNNTNLLQSAQYRAQQLIKNYIERMAEIAGVEYKITWLDEDGTSITDTMPSADT